MLGLMQDWPLTVDKIIDHAKNWHGEREVVFACDAEAVGVFAGAREDLEEMLGNLLDNALRYSPPGSPVTLAVRLAEHAQRSGIRIGVSNQPGRAGRPDPDRLFDRHYRAPGASHLAGSGLGLYIARGIVQLLGGEIVYRAEPDIIQFEVWLPC